jgi:hypothetical protein
MSKRKNIYKYWCSKEQYNHVIKYPKLMSSDIQLYKISDEIKFYKSLQADRLHIPNTLKLFFFYHHNINFQKSIKDVLRPLAKYDIVFNFQKEKYLFHTYKILGFINESLNALSLSQNKQFQKKTIATYDKREKDYYFSEYKENKKQALKPTNINKGNNLLQAFLYRNLYYRKAFTKYFLSYYSIIGIENLKQLNNDFLQSKIIKNTLRIFQSGLVRKKDCAKSLLSVLYFYFIHKMRINKRHALSIAKNIVYNIYDIYYEYKGSEILTNIYVKEVIGSHIIYSFDTKKEHINKGDKTYLKKVISDNLINAEKFPLQVIIPSLNNPLILYSLLTPSELLQKI